MDSPANVTDGHTSYLYEVLWKGGIFKMVKRRVVNFISGVGLLVLPIRNFISRVGLLIYDVYSRRWKVSCDGSDDDEVGAVDNGEHIMGDVEVETPEVMEVMESLVEVAEDDNSNSASNDIHENDAEDKKEAEESDEKVKDDDDDSPPRRPSYNVPIPPYRFLPGLSDDIVAGYPLCIQCPLGIMSRSHQLQCVNEMVWNVDIFKLDEETNLHSLYAVTKVFMDELKPTFVNKDAFFGFLRSLELSYFDQPYHGRQHAALVVHHACCISNVIGLSAIMTPLEKFSLILASAGHDIAHPALGNDFFAKSGHPLSVLYNSSLLEHYHASNLLRLFNSRTGILSEDLSQDELHNMRELIIDLILATDVGTHGAYLDTCNQKRRQFCLNVGTPMAEDRRLVMCGVVKGADVAYVSLETNIAEDWIYRVYEEFWAQGDEEIRSGLVMSPQCERRNVEWTPNFFWINARFIRVVVAPIIIQLCRFEQIIKTAILKECPFSLPYREADLQCILLRRFNTIRVVKRHSRGRSSCWRRADGNGAGQNDDGGNDGNCQKDNNCGDSDENGENNDNENSNTNLDDCHSHHTNDEFDYDDDDFSDDEGHVYLARRRFTINHVDQATFRRRGIEPPFIDLDHDLRRPNDSRESNPNYAVLGGGVEVPRRRSSIRYGPKSAMRAIHVNERLKNLFLYPTQVNAGRFEDKFNRSIRHGKPNDPNRPPPLEETPCNSSICSRDSSTGSQTERHVDDGEPQMEMDYYTGLHDYNGLQMDYAGQMDVDYGATDICVDYMDSATEMGVDDTATEVDVDYMDSEDDYDGPICDSPMIHTI
eukprot:GHVO01048060.1.p1 GENE.GHVO01048060.1~~GHVO01048060.1.p1  ORF type:complete len:838 (-),score=115.74 GHVO01048060.1:84-2543(-)